MLTNILKTIKQKGFILNDRPFELNIVGIRSSTSIPNSFDDTINVFYINKNGSWIFKSFKATTDPGTWWLLTLMNPDGTAILKPGQYVHSHRIGVHRNKYQALVQQNPVTVYRDNNRNSRIDYNPSNQQTGIFGINIHRASINGITSYIDKHSAGCQVLADVNDFNILMQLAERQKDLYGNNFTYTLLDENEIAE